MAHDGVPVPVTRTLAVILACQCQYRRSNSDARHSDRGPLAHGHPPAATRLRSPSSGHPPVVTVKKTVTDWGDRDPKGCLFQEAMGPACDAFVYGRV